MSAPAEITGLIYRLTERLIRYAGFAGTDSAPPPVLGGGQYIVDQSANRFVDESGNGMIWI